jgi:DHA3 family tetracycline resistance protein-like MFS transporter
MAMSLLGDGIYFVAIAWQAYQLADSPAALSIVGVAWMLSAAVFALIGGAVSDRFPRQRVLMAAAAVQAAAIGAMGALAISGALRLWMLAVLAACYGGAQAFFAPAFEALIPTLLPADELAPASGLDRFVRPLATQIVGPAVGGVIVAAAGTGLAFLLDAVTFMAVIAAALATSPQAESPRQTTRPRHAAADIAEGFRFVRASPWLWGTLLAAGLALLAYAGPSQVLLPFVVRNDLHANAATLGAIRAVAGLGALPAAVIVAQRGLPARVMKVMIGAWALQTLVLLGYGLAGRVWIFFVVSTVGGAARAVGDVIWGTLLKTRVPNRLLGRVASFDWLVSLALVPASLALTAPLGALLGARVLLILAGPLAAVALLSFLAVPGMHDPVQSEPVGRQRTSKWRAQIST